MASSSERRIRRSDPSTIQDKFIVGYQGWFTCGGDGEPVGPGHHGWLHWFNFPLPDGGRPNTDLWPDVSSYSPSELYPAPGLKTSSGEQAFLFSSRNAKTVERRVVHFHWMAEHGVDGAFLQRFAGQTDLEAGNEGIRRIRDEVGDRVREAAEKEGRVFAIMYDVSGVPADRIAMVLERDWAHLVRVKGLLDSPNYLKEKGRPVIGLWGFGFDAANHTPSLLRSIISHFRASTPGGAYIFAGVPAHWRTSEGDADRNPEFVDVWLNDVDAISPWTIGRYSNELEADGFAETKIKADSELLKKRVEEGFRKVDYVPVVFPGGSGYNLSEGRWGWNGIKRNGGRFLWKQVYNARKYGVRTMYGAMWDEYDEGTAFMPVVTHKRLLPESDKFKFMALDEDGYDLPPDWYMRICGFAAEVLHGERRIFETFPSKELQDYWSNRPKYEEIPVGPVASGSGSGAGSSAGAGGALNAAAGGSADANVKPPGQSYEEWLVAQNEEKEEVPPPPYSLEADEAPVAASSSAAAGVAQPARTTSNVPPAQAVVAAGPIPTTGVAPTTTPTTSTAASGQPNNQRPAPPPTHPARPPHTPTPDPVASLTNEFGRTNISPPPLHPSHPANAVSSASGSGYGRPPPVPNLSTRPTSHSPVPTMGAAGGRPQQPQVNMATRPSSSGPYPPPNQPPPSSQQPPYQHQPYNHQQQQEGSNTSGAWSQSQWPPPEWKVNNNNAPASSAPYQAYNAGGANLTRPHTLNAGSGSGAGIHRPLSAGGGGANLRPSASLGGAARPTAGGSGPGSPTFPGGPPGGPGFPMGAPGGGGGGGGSQSPAMSMYPGQQAQSSMYPGQQSPGLTYPGQHTSTYPGQSLPGQQVHAPSSPYPGQQYTSGNTTTYPGQQSFYHSPPHSPPPSGQPQPSWPSTTGDPSLGGPAGYQPSYQPSGPHAHAPHGSLSSSPPGPGGPQFPNVNAHSSSTGPGPAFPGVQHGGHGSYGGGGYFASQQQQQYGGGSAAFPQPHGGPPGGGSVSPGPWMPGTTGHGHPGGSGPPPFPPRPNSSSPYGPPPNVPPRGYRVSLWHRQVRILRV
ncbi:hypothetical protein D9756_004390 [Leucocoprinus leucothites]|uniref:Xylosidase/arabinosidase n=1 Tax=Leucocoprinus leucothites TaxID=201217 RepID=A0A8H5DAK5_9AGAR|nr:hypothetical protein D9756_004390 [Leucoagaricus leucothites]